MTEATPDSIHAVARLAYAPCWPTTALNQLQNVKSATMHTLCWFEAPQLRMMHAYDMAHQSLVISMHSVQSGVTEL